MGILQSLFEIAISSGNWGAVVFGVFGMGVAGVLGYWVKKPMIKQSMENHRFLATLKGYEQLTGELREDLQRVQKRNDFLENQIIVRDGYIDELLKRIRQMEDRKDHHNDFNC